MPLPPDNEVRRVDMFAAAILQGLLSNSKVVTTQTLPRLADNPVAEQELIDSVYAFAQLMQATSETIP